MGHHEGAGEARRCRHQGGDPIQFRIPECHTPFRDRGNEASIRVPSMFHSHV
jgi:hypothetical protein